MLKKTVSFLKKSETAKSGLWYLISNFALNGMAFITVPIFTRLLSVEDYGTVSVYMSIVAVMTIVSGLDLHIGIGRAIIDFDRDYQKY